MLHTATFISRPTAIKFGPVAMMRP